jgi:hypothetical protein
VARGWESKSVEEQQAAAVVPTELKQRLTPQQLIRKRDLEALQLSRRRVLQQLASVHNPLHREMLEKALAEIDLRISHLG